MNKMRKQLDGKLNRAIDCCKRAIEKIEYAKELIDKKCVNNAIEQLAWARASLLSAVECTIFCSAILKVKREKDDIAEVDQDGKNQ